ncbi:HAD domain-containing protein [Aromatoleum toluclasticum]|uniref:HAD domain-containing protein n=1 Tax=Aromatoleum toluclasticum TaxID=92003 RepID=UPI000379CAB5|nr:HAD domain-containing protein [Aromatoleum toluclasticum]
MLISTMRPKRDPEAPTLFLDFDGVLHPDAVYRVRGEIVLYAEGVALFEWAPLLDEYLIPYSELQIVLSTSWVRVLGFDVARGWLPEGLQRRVVGATWHRQGPRDWVFLTRYEQIILNVRRHQHSRWLAIDDMGDGWADEHREHLVLTDSTRGLGPVEVQEELREKLEVLCR